MSPLASYRTSMNSMYENEPVRIVVSTQFLIKMGLAGFLIWAGWHYRNAACSHNLSLWLWVNGAAWLFFLSVFALSVVASSGASEAATFTLAACFPCLLCAMCVAGPFLLIWFVVGNIWVFTGSTATCDSGLYRTAFWYLIALYIWGVISCCCLGGARYREITVVGGPGYSAPLMGSKV